jgi:hypothetical protein
MAKMHFKKLGLALGSHFTPPSMLKKKKMLIKMADHYITAPLCSLNAAWRAALVPMRAIASSITPHACPLQGRRRPTPRTFAPDAGGITTVETCASAAAKLWTANRSH